jgi:hypothetical protein
MTPSQLISDFAFDFAGLLTLTMILGQLLGTRSK